MFGNMIADLMIKPGKSPVFDNPKMDFGLEYEDVTFQTRDGVMLSGWLIRGGNDKVIIQSHFGVQCSRSGYSPKVQGMIKMWGEDIRFLNQAKYLVEAGYSVLMYDLRNHGDSGSGDCPWVTWGPREALDVIAAVDFVSNHTEFKKANIGLFSICMGTSATALAYGVEEGLKNYDNINALVSVQPLTYAKFVKAFGIPNFMVRSSNKKIEERTGIDFNHNTFMPVVKEIAVPTLVIQNKNDPWMDLNLVQEYFNNLTVEKKIIWPELAQKRAAAYDWIGKNPEEILSWFGKHV